MKKIVLAVLGIITIISVSFGQAQKAKTRSGQKVLLYADGTWKYEDAKQHKFLDQGSYANLGASSITNDQGVNMGINLGAGFKGRTIGIGFVTDFYGIDKAKLAFATAAIDLRRYIFKKYLSPYISIQPGYTLHDKTLNGIETKGNFAFAAMLGCEGRLKLDRTGINIAVGYQYTSFKDVKVTTKSHSLKATISIVL